MAPKYRTKLQSNPLRISPDIPRYFYATSHHDIVPSLEAYVRVYIKMNALDPVETPSRMMTVNDLETNGSPQSYQASIV